MINKKEKNKVANELYEFIRSYNYNNFDEFAILRRLKKIYRKKGRLSPKRGF